MQGLESEVLKQQGLSSAQKDLRTQVYVTGNASKISVYCLGLAELEWR